MTDAPRVLVVGGAGMLGRPVSRALVDAGYDVRVFMRSAQQAGRLPDACTPIVGDVRQGDVLRQAIADVDAVHLSLNTPFSRKTSFDPDRDGTALVVEAALETSRPHITRLSALGAPEGREAWWSVARKVESDDLVLGSGLDATVVRCDWFMESLALMVMGPLMFDIRVPREPLHWLAARDFGEMIVAAVRNRVTGVFDAHGPEPVSMYDATRRFMKAWPKRLLCVPCPVPLLRVAGLFDAQPRYGAQVMDHTFRYATGFRGDEAWTRLAKPTTTIEQYVESIAATGDMPRKPPGITTWVEKRRTRFP